jgi:hypothetical protein
VVTRTVDARGSTLTLGRDFLPKEMTMTDISNCPKCGATVTVDTFQEGDPMGIFCSACGFVYFVPQEVDTVEGLIAKWNSQPVIEKLRAEVAELKEAARWIPVEESLPKEHSIALVATEFENFRVAYQVMGRWYNVTSGGEIVGVTHYRLLPLPPDALP